MARRSVTTHGKILRGPPPVTGWTSFLPWLPKHYSRVKDEGYNLDDSISALDDQGSTNSDWFQATPSSQPTVKSPAWFNGAQASKADGGDLLGASPWVLRTTGDSGEMHIVLSQEVFNELVVRNSAVFQLRFISSTEIRLRITSINHAFAFVGLAFQTLYHIRITCSSAGLWNMWINQTQSSNVDVSRDNNFNFNHWQFQHTGYISECAVRWSTGDEAAISTAEELTSIHDYLNTEYGLYP